MDDNTKKLVLALTKAIFGLIGVDCFIAKNNKMGIKRIVWTVILSVLSPLVIPAFALTALQIYFLVTGLMNLGKTLPEIEAEYR